LASGAIDPDLQMFAKFSPDARQVAFVRGNNLWVTELATGRATRLTTDGSDDIINGTTDWVYEEEFGLADAFRWSPDSKRLAFWRFDQSTVPAFPMVDELRRYPEVSVLRYPKAGAPNARLRIGVIAATGGPVRFLEIGADTGQYVPRMEWADSDSLALIRMPRKQNEMALLMISATSGTGRTVTTDRDSAYVDVEGEPVRWLGGSRFLLRSDRTGWRQWFLYDRRGTLIRQVTRDGVDVLDLSSIDEARGFVYATVAAPTPRDEQVVRFSLDGRTAPLALTTTGGSHSLDVAPGARFAQYVTSTLNAPPVTRIVSLPRMTAIRTEADNSALSARLRATALAPATFVRIPMPDGTQLDGYRIVPPDFDSTRAHPVVLHTYGGPAAPSVVDRWGGRNFLFHQALAQRGYIVLVVDPRGAAWRGRAFRKVTQYQLGIRESDDMIAVARWLATQRWADRARLGMWGWSYGGFMTAMTTARGGSLFKAGIVVAPVTDYRYYDTIYTERFMWTPDANSDGYRKSSVMTHVNTLAARLLLVHGTGDDNVHPQNTLNLVDALVQANKPFEMLLYPNRTHSITGGNTTPHLYESFLRFLLEHL
jgi:dipeptidyl-peptidase 4